MSSAGTSPAPIQTFVLTPHRSLGSRGFAILMALYGGVSFVAGLVFYLKGAWPVVGFCGLDVALLYGAFRLNYGGARGGETITVTREAVAVRSVDPAGAARESRFNAYWTQVELREHDLGACDVWLKSAGRSREVGRCLGAEERRRLAAELRSALAEARTGLSSQP